MMNYTVITRACQFCGASITGRPPDALYCNAQCRRAAARRRRKRPVGLPYFRWGDPFAGEPLTAEDY